MRTYTLVISPDPEEDGYNVTVPAIPGCLTDGETLAEAIENGKIAIQEWIEVFGAPDEKEAPRLETVSIG